MKQQSETSFFSPCFALQAVGFGRTKVEVVTLLSSGEYVTRLQLLILWEKKKSPSLARNLSVGLIFKPMQMIKDKAALCKNKTPRNFYGTPFRKYEVPSNFVKMPRPIFSRQRYEMLGNEGAVTLAAESAHRANFLLCQGHLDG